MRPFSAHCGLRRVPAEPKPAYPKGIVFDDPVAKFAEVLEGVGGVCVRVATAQEADARLRELEAYRGARQIASFVPGVGESTFDCSQSERPHDLKDLDFVILPGEFGVAENAAVWVPGSALGRHRVVFVIAQHLALVVNGHADRPQHAGSLRAGEAWRASACSSRGHRRPRTSSKRWSSAPTARAVARCFWSGEARGGRANCYAHYLFAHFTMTP